MGQTDRIAGWLRRRLPELLDEHKVPAAAVAVLAHDEVVDHAAGVLNLATGVEATSDALFQVGSITKVWTATLVMQLVDEGRLDIDAPVRTYLPEFRLADAAAVEVVTARHLLSHTAGFEGDLLDEDAGVGDDCLARLLPSVGRAGQLSPPGSMFSYNNVGFSVLGRLVEVLRGEPYDRCLRRYLVEPLGLTHVAPSPYEAVMYRVAHGHLASPSPTAPPRPAPVWALPRSGSPAGAMLAMRPRDLLAFVRMHLASGQGGGTRVLGARSALAMRERQVELPYLPGTFGDAWGLGWQIFDWPGGTVLGHDGDTVGQCAYLRVVPDRGVAVAVFANGDSARGVYAEVAGLVLRELAGVEPPPHPSPAAGVVPADPSRYLGVYASTTAESTVSRDADGRLWLDWVPRGVYAELGGQPERHELVPLSGDTMVTAQKWNGRHRPYTFVGSDAGGHARYLHTGRAEPWVGPAGGNAAGRS